MRLTALRFDISPTEFLSERANAFLRVNITWQATQLSVRSISS